MVAEETTRVKAEQDAVQYEDIRSGTMATTGSATEAGKRNEASSGYCPPREVLISAPPPLHSVGLVGLVVATAVRYCPSMEDIDAQATPETFSRVLFPDYLNVRALGCIRLFFAATIFLTTLNAAVGQRSIVVVPYLPGSKLARRPLRLGGRLVLRTLTYVVWNLLGVCFSIGGAVALWIAASAGDGRNDDDDDDDADAGIPPWAMRTALVIWKVSGPLSFLVSVTVRYAIWPATLKAKSDTTSLRRVRTLMTHNANVLFVLSEMALLGGLPVQWSDVTLGMLFGCAYIIFSWNITMTWSSDPQKDGPQFIYFFLDTTLGVKTSAFLLALMVTFASFHAAFVVTESILARINGGLPAHVFFVATVASLCMRFRD